LFRPFHELTGNWFWWGNRHASADQIKEIWRFTADYLRKTKKLNHLIMVYNTNDFKRESDFLRCYPGDDYVDILSFDTYQYDINKKQQFIRMVKQQAAVVCKLAKERNKIAAFAETGFENIPDSTWWTGTLLPAIKDYPLAYVLVWRNAGLMPSTQKMHYYAPYKDQQSADDFKKFYQNKRILFEKSLRTKQIYQSK
jgi:mannan endo-1,4-beta-mannosidase